MKRKQKQINPTAVFVIRQIKQFTHWVTDGVQKMLIIALVVIIGGNFLGVNVLGLFKSKVGVDRELKANEDARISGDMNRKILHVQEKGKKTVTHEGVRKFEYSKLKSGKIIGKVKNRGLSLEPGFVLGAGDGLRIGGDIQYAYWKRFGLGVGATIPVQDRTIHKIRGHASFIYSPSLKLFPHSSLFGGLDTNKTPIIGLRTEF